jgi:hypothetical protein
MAVAESGSLRDIATRTPLKSFNSRRCTQMMKPSAAKGALLALATLALFSFAAGAPTDGKKISTRRTYSQKIKSSSPESEYMK